MLPECAIELKYLVITKPIKIKGQIGSSLIITEGPVIIKIGENYENELVKFSQVVINFKVNEDNIQTNQAKENTYLFKLYPGSLVEFEDCDLSCEKSKSRKKLICFQVNSKYTAQNGTNLNKDILINSVSILTIVSTRITKFYQTIRAGENSIINIEKSFITHNIGKAIVILNPLIVKVIESVFESNMDNALHIKFIKDENLSVDPRKLYFDKNDISYNYGNGIYIDGIENFFFDLDVVISNNIIRKNKVDGVFICDVFVNSLIVSENKFTENKANGLNLQKVYHKLGNNPIKSNIMSSTNSLSLSSNSEMPSINIRNNEFSDSEGFGVFLNESRAILNSNNFIRNKAAGMIMCNINFLEFYNNINNNSNKDNVYNTLGSNQMSMPSNIIKTNTSASDTVNLLHGTSFLTGNNFLKNGGSGLKVYNYNYLVHITDCKFIENCDFGIQAENDLIIDKEKLKIFKNSDSNKIPKEAHLVVVNSSIVSNLKSGLSINNTFIYFDNSSISDNIDYAIFTNLEESRHFFKTKSSKLINGSIGGPWGEYNISNKTLCSSCTTVTKAKKPHSSNSSEKNSSNPRSGNDILPSQGGQSNSNSSKPNVITESIPSSNSNSNPVNSNSNSVKNKSKGKSGEEDSKPQCLVV